MKKNKLKLIEKDIYEIKKTGTMLVPAKIFTSKENLNLIDDETISQLENVASLPGIINNSIAMPDIHKGYGFPIGGVAVFDKDKGIITPGGIGFDINCGVRVLISNFTKEEVEEKKEELLDYFLEHIDVGMPSKNSKPKFKINRKQLDEVLEKGAKWAIENNFGNKEDLEFCEENGCFSGANKKKVSQKAKGKGMNQLGSLGSGNHFIEIQYVDEIFNDEVAEIFGITKKNQVVVMIHCGSRGLGHQVASDYIKEIQSQNQDGDSFFSNLEYAKINSPLMLDYFSAMKAAANYAFCNRQIMTHFVREGFEKVVGGERLEVRGEGQEESKENKKNLPPISNHQPPTSLKLLYDVCHNIAKFEKHIVDASQTEKVSEGLGIVSKKNSLREEREVLVHRKGATRSFGKGSKDIPKKYQNDGQPVLLPGSMGTSSYILCGNNNSMKLSFGSCAHGAGRKYSRTESVRKFDAKQIQNQLQEKGVLVKGTNSKGLCEESPDSYKNVDDIVKIIDDKNIANLVVKLKPIAVIKG